MSEEVAQGRTPESQDIVHQEVIIDIHVRHLKLQIAELMTDQAPGLEGPLELPVRIIWSRGKKQAKTQYKKLSKEVDLQVFDEKFQINTVLELNSETEMPTKPKDSKLSICLDRNHGGKELAHTIFDMADFKYGKYNGQRLFLEQNENNTEYNFDQSKAYLEIGIKGTKQDGLVQQRMKVIKQKMATDLAKNFNASGSSPSKDPASTEGSQDMHNIFKSEYEKLMTESKVQRKEYEKKLAEKDAKLNQVNTLLENQKTELKDTHEIANNYSDTIQGLTDQVTHLQNKSQQLVDQAKLDTDRVQSLTANQQNELHDQVYKLTREVDQQNKNLQDQRETMINFYSFEKYDIGFDNQVSKLFSQIQGKKP